MNNNNNIINGWRLEPKNKKRLDEYFKERRTRILKLKNNKLKDENNKNR